MNRHDEAHAACLNILNDNEHSAPRIAELCTFTRQLGGEIDDLRAERDRLAAENAERDRLAAENAELGAELARVKAESLRVVKIGEPCVLGACRESHFFTGVSDILSCADEFVIGMYGDQVVQPVRLERWEDEHARS